MVCSTHQYKPNCPYKHRSGNDPFPRYTYGVVWHYQPTFRGSYSYQIKVVSKLVRPETILCRECTVVVPLPRKWGYLKGLVYASSVESVAELQQRVDNGCRQIRQNQRLSERIHTSLSRRAASCIQANGGHFEHLL